MADLTVSNDIDNFMQSANNAAARNSLGLSNVDNTSDANKPVSTAQQAALDTEAATRLAADNRRAHAGGVVLNGGNISLRAIAEGQMAATYHFAGSWNGSNNQSTNLIGSDRFNFNKEPRSLALFADPIGTITLSHTSDGSFSNRGPFVAGPTMALGENFTATGTIDTTGLFTLYVNGEFVESAQANSTHDSGLHDTLLVINGAVAGDSIIARDSNITCRDASIFDRALSAAEAAELSEIGIEAWLAKYPEDQWGGDEGPLTSGTLTVGKRYRIATFVAGDDFTNVGAASNATGVEFVATGTTPTTWTNSSELKDIGVLAVYLLNEGNGRQPRDLSGRYDALLSATGYQHLKPKTEGYVRVKGADANPSIMMLEDSDIIPADAVWTQIIAEERIVNIANTAQDLAARRVRLANSTGDLIIQRSDGTNHETLGTVTTPTDTDDVDVEVHYKQVIR